ncbi:sigma-E factor negative regulatory protein [Sphaerotilus sp.]|uniref:sigma-E factor negative regulatory protein n=1 Tax=Sphaerotilus sp. TaxID=2093942 RepID=UPI002ACE8812|nr:sigma-E factor negative regulatory protein [Sphaerotilus sp.]MDZ7857549.1 sigma-E factor negative regulatory protein [Sphaerotilus sp.]
MTESDLPEDQTRARERLSSLMDGDCSADAVASACRHWRQDADTRAQWHAYHLIGDVLRSEDLSRRSGADAEFLQAVRMRLAQEPVVLAPTAMPPPSVQEVEANIHQTAATGTGGQRHSTRSRFHLRRWVAPVGMAAGVALVASAVLVTRPGGGSGGPTLATAPQISTVQTAAGSNTTSPDSELVRYLDAHQQFPGTPALGPAPGFMRSAAYEPIPSR